LDDFLKTNPDFGIVRPITFDNEGARRLDEEKHLVFTQNGKLYL
jgi:hypothetical protein